MNYMKNTIHLGFFSLPKVMERKTLFCISVVVVFATAGTSTIKSMMVRLWCLTQIIYY